MVKVQVNSSGKVYVNGGGKALAASSSGGSAVINSLNVTPTTSAQTITATSGVDGYSPINVSAVTSSIDSNITAGNIKSGVSILGVTGSYSGGSESSIFGLTISDIFSLNSNGELVSGEGEDSVYLNFSGLTKIKTAKMALMFYDRDDLHSISFPNLTEINFAYALYKTFNGCGDISTVSFPSLVTIKGTEACSYTFEDMDTLRSINLPELTTINGGKCCSAMFMQTNEGPVSINMPKLTTISGNYACSMMFQNITMSSFTFESLNYISGTQPMQEMFYNGGLDNLYFPALTSSSFANNRVLQNLCNGLDSTTVHFPSNLSSVMSSWTDVTNGFGGNDITVLFDLTATS